MSRLPFSTATTAVVAAVLLGGVEQVTFRSEAVAGRCGPSDESSVVLGDGHVE